MEIMLRVAAGGNREVGRVCVQRTEPAATIRSAGRAFCKFDVSDSDVARNNHELLAIRFMDFRELLNKLIRDFCATFGAGRSLSAFHGSHSVPFVDESR